MKKIENTKHTRTTRERAIARIVKLTNEIYSIQKQRTTKHKDQTYYRIKAIEHLFDENIGNYYEPILIRSSFNNNFEEYEIRSDKLRTLTIKKYL